MELLASGQTEICVSLDLETTGLDPISDHIIEIGAIKFQGDQVLDKLDTFINPYAPIPEFVRDLTGINQDDLESAPSFAAVSSDISDFVSDLPIVGHNVSFDIEFLSRHGLVLNNPTYDTWDLASILLPRSDEYSLNFLAHVLCVDNSTQHRAMADAETTQKVFLKLMDKLQNLDLGTKSHIELLAKKAHWPVGKLFNSDMKGTSGVSLNGIDVKGLEDRLAKPPAFKKSKSFIALNDSEVAALVSPGQAISQTLSSFEHRPQQIEMMSAITKAINNSEHLIVEGGTGVGKSLAYLLPAILFSVENGRRVVISTNTINLQEQLLYKDIPLVVRTLENQGLIPPGKFVASSLKGRSNYLCLQRWNGLSKANSLSNEEAQLLSKCLVWLQDTNTGDRGEINLAKRERGIWNRISASDAGKCLGLRGEPCFLRAARERSEASHIIVVNHALLLSDVSRGNTVIPDYQYLIIDEAQHLEREATQQLGIRMSQAELPDLLENLTRYLTELNIVLKGPNISSVQKVEMNGLTGEIEITVAGLLDKWTLLWSEMRGFLSDHHEEGTNRMQVRITGGLRSHEDWRNLETRWESVYGVMEMVQTSVERLISYIDLIASDNVDQLTNLSVNLDVVSGRMDELKRNLHTFVGSVGHNERVDWLSQEGDLDVMVNLAPLNVGTRLEVDLFRKKECVILTSATLRTEVGFDHLRQRLGLPIGNELHVESPFDYSKSAQVVIADDIPEPGHRGYNKALEDCLYELVIAGDGHTMVLFTSYSALRGVREALSKNLKHAGISVFAQGVDGSPHRIVRNFSDRPKSVLLGTSSLWEGVDLPSGTLKILVFPRLPFNVPTEPVFAARSEQYDDAFMEYAVPQAVLRFRQGFGRLIRKDTDRGIVVVLDRRILSKPYGKSFLGAIPSCTVKKGPMSIIPSYVSQWLSSKI